MYKHHKQLVCDTQTRCLCIANKLFKMLKQKPIDRVIQS